MKMCSLIFDAFANVGFRALQNLGEILMFSENLTFCRFEKPTELELFVSNAFENLKSK